MIEPHGERIELRLPVFAVAVEPQRGVKDRPRIEPAPADPTDALLSDEAGADQDLDVARHRLQRDRERRGDFGNQQRSFVEPLQDRAADGIAEGEEHGIQGVGGLIARHGNGKGGHIRK